MRILMLAIFVVGLSFGLTINCVYGQSGNGLVAYWPEDGNNNDVIGGHNPSATNAISFVQGKIGAGVSLGSGGYIDIPDAPAFQNQQLTVSAWVRPDGPGPNNDQQGSTFIQKGVPPPAGNNGGSTGMWWSAQDYRFRFTVGSISNTVTSANIFPAGLFYHVTGTYDGAHLRLYVNGQLEAERTLLVTIPYDSTVPWTIGSSYDFYRNLGYPRTFNGVIDEVKLYNRALLADEIQNGYQPGCVPTLDQRFFAVPQDSGGFNFRTGDESGPPNNRLAQIYTAGTTGNLARVRLPLNASLPGSPNSITVQIRDAIVVTAQTILPGNTVFGASTMDGTGLGGLPFNGVWSSFEFSIPVPQVQGTRYAIVLSSTSYTRWWAKDGDPYPPGVFDRTTSDGNNWFSFGGIDAGFETYTCTANQVIDSDADGVEDSSDNCPDVVNATQADADTDGEGDACDADIDGDTVPNGSDNCPLNANSEQADSDHDGVGNVCDDDDDNDGIQDIADNCALHANADQLDGDSDGSGDACDEDDDNDGVLDIHDNCPLDLNSDQNDLDGDGLGDACENDTDGDGVDNDSDNCLLLANSDQLNTDGDSQGDVCDSDDDNDDILDSTDNCPVHINLDQADTDGDSAGDACDADDDGDAIGDNEDNCPLDVNFDQTDTDTDSDGDVCDSDDDNDNVFDVYDNCPFTANPNQADTDGDGEGNTCDGDIDGDDVPNQNDNCLLNPNADQSDLDGDRVGDSCDADIDGDGASNENDTCPASDRMPLVLVGYCNSRVLNHLLVNGCTTSDLIAECVDSATNHGNFVNCVARLLQNLKNNGLITGQQKGAIQSCAAQANIP